MTITYWKVGRRIVEDEQGQLLARKGISREVIDELSKVKNEPDWMREKRLRSYEIFERQPLPKWGVPLEELNFDDLVLYSPPTTGRFNSWDDVPDDMKKTFERLGIPEQDRAPFLNESKVRGRILDPV